MYYIRCETSSEWLTFSVDKPVNFYLKTDILCYIFSQICIMVKN